MCRDALSLVLIMFLVLSFASFSSGEFYKWTDKDGGVHYSDSPIDIPDTSMGKDQATKPLSKNPPSKKGWNQDNINLAIIGCTYGMLNPNLDSYRQRALDEGHQVTDDEMEKINNMLFPICNRTCTCVIENISQKWSYEKFSNFTKDSTLKSEYQHYITSLIKNNICPLPIPSQ